MNDMLVSVVVVTYNSSEFIIEALESVKNQTYQNIELIISDDCSQDDTVGLCEEWLKKNSDRFNNFELITHDKNTGNTANYNRGWKRAKGEWIKNLDGDDRLLPNCISDYVDFIHRHPEADLVFANMNSFNSKGKVLYEKKRNVGGVFFQKMSKSEFKIAVYLYNTISSPTIIIKRHSFNRLGGFDETYKYIEDWPMWMRMVYEGYNFQFMDKITVEYRLSNYSISQSSSNNPHRCGYDKCAHEVHEKSIWYLRNHSLLASFYFYTKKRKDCGSIFWRMVHGIHIFNPFYYRFKNVQKHN